MDLRNARAGKLAAALILILVFHCATAEARQRRSQMQVSCVILPFISLELDGQNPIFGRTAATVVSEPGQRQLTGKTNDATAAQFVLTANSAAQAVVNGIAVGPGQDVEVGRYSYGAPILLEVTGTAPIRLTASR